MGNFFCSSQEMRDIILNAHKIRELNKCEICNATGYIHWNGETGENMKPGKGNDEDGITTTGECEKCEGVGYKDVYLYCED